LALALGSTVADLKDRMTLAEFCEWAAYVDLYGGLDYRRRYDNPAALISYTTQAAQGGKATFMDFVPYQKLPETFSDLSDFEQQFLKASRK
jgi:hypothetical protein